MIKTKDIILVFHCNLRRYWFMNKRGIDNEYTRSGM